MPSIAQVRAVHKSQLGVAESPPGSNHQPYSAAFGRPPEAWCADYQSWVWIKGCGASTGPYGLGPNGSPGCSDWTAHVDSHGGFHSTPKIGDHVLYGRNGSEHIGWVDAVDATGIWTYEGNTNNTGSNSGGQVCYQHRDFSSYIYGFGTPDYSDTEGDDLTPDQAAQLQQAHDAVARLEQSVAQIHEAVADIQSRVGNDVEPKVDQILEDATLIAPKNPPAS